MTTLTKTLCKAISALAIYTLLSQLALAQQVTVVTNRMMLEAKKDLIRDSAGKAGLALVFADTSLSDAALAEHLRNNQFVLVEMPREMDVQAFEQRLQELSVEIDQPLLQTSGSQFSSENLEPQTAQTLGRYYVNGGRSNIDTFFAAVQRVLAGQSLEGLPALIEMPEQGAYHPALTQQFTENPDDILEQLQHRAGQPVIALGFHVRYLQSNAMAHIDQLVAWVEAAGAFALPVFYSLGPDARLVELLRGRANALLHLQPVYHNGLQEQLDALGIPVLQGIGWWNDSIEGWENSPSGLSLSSTPLYLALPEQNGLIDPLVMWAEQDGELKLIDYQARAAIDKAVKLAALQMKPLAEQKVAVMVYNYPPGEQNLSASFMNVPRSLALLSQQWQEQGYRTRAFSEQELIDGLGGAIQATHNPQDGIGGASQSSLSLAAYQAWFEQLPTAVQSRINDYWGEPAQSPLLTTVDGQPAFRIPYLDAGNMVYLGQPSRGRPGEDNERALYHDMRVPINHYYLATYLWLRDVFGADALVHFGTHGTQEWMPGKERGLSIYDDSLLILGDIPVVYPYIIDDVGEAVQAKRRGRAVMISHQTPPFRPSGLHGTLVDLHQLIHQWETLEPGPVRDNTVERLLELAAQDELTADLGWTLAQANAKPADFIQALHDYLHQLAAQSQPIGLHTYADNAQEQKKLTTVMQMLGDGFIEAFGLAEPQELFVEDYQSLALTPPYQWLEKLLVTKEALTPELAQWQSLARTYYASLDTAGEWSSLDAALRGRHVEPGIGGDPIRVPDSLPSGKNLVGFDPARIPTREAWLAGKQAIDELIAQHREEQGKWPERLAFSLWAVEAMRHGGILESQAFYAMGVEPVWDRGGRVSGFDVVPREELGRPRVDVVLSVTGLYRDQFPNVMAHLAAAAAEVSRLDEDDNPVYQHSRKLLADLLQKDIPEDEARQMAETRVFGSPTGVYGTGLEDASLASDTWEGEDKLAKLYLNRMSHAFGPDSSQWDQAADFSELYAANLETVDAALLARTSNLYGMLTTDDPFQYLGGIDLAVRHLTGKSPELYISNQRRRDKVSFQSADEFLAMEMTTRTFHPGWIKAMQEEGFAGALNLQDMTNNLWGWQVVAPAVVKAHQWQKMHDIYVMDSLDLGLNEWFEKHSAEARLRMMERLLDAIRKNYWDAPQQTQRELVAAYQASLEKNDLQAAHGKLAAFADRLAAGFGLNPVAFDSLASPQAAVGVNTPVAAQTQQVEGQKLEKTLRRGADADTQWWWLALLVLPLFTGAYRQYRQTERT